MRETSETFANRAELLGARAEAVRARERGAAYLDGKIMGDPPYVGTPNVMFPFSGSRSAFAAHQPTLEVLGRPSRAR